MAILKSCSVDSDMSCLVDESEINLSDDLIAEIILRLPFKSVARSKCVSKNWCATISDDYLRRRLPLHMSMICYPDGGSGPRYACAGGGDGRWLQDCDLGFFPLHDGAVVLDGCNGLLLFRAPGTPEFYVVSPVTRRWVALPRPEKDARLSVLAFDPLSSPHYHVINFAGWRERGAAVEVFSSEAWAWAAVRDAEFGVPATSLSGSMHCHDGAVYILASDPGCVVRMDVAGGLACTVVELPEPTDGGDAGRVAHSGGRLHYVCSDGESLRLWALEGTSTSPQWRLKHAVKVSDAVEGGCRGGDEVRFLALHPEKDKVYMWSPWKVTEYDLRKKEITGAAWEFGKGAKNRVVKTWLIPTSCYLSDCLTDGSVQC